MHEYGHHFLKMLRKIYYFTLVGAKAQAAKSDSARTIDHWSKNLAGSDAFSAEVYWLAIPEVQSRYQAKATQRRANNWVEYFLKKFFESRLPVAHMASIGCGTGDLERHLARLNAFTRCHAFDISPTAIDVARQKAIQENIASIEYAVRDVNEFEWPTNLYDAVWFNGSLHHVDKLEYVCMQATQSLKPEGFLFFNEYIGPSRFDFTDRQKAVIEIVFDLIPKQFRKSFLPNYPYAIMQSAPIPNPDKVYAADPSEAVRSDEIMPVLQQYFEIVEYNEMGGSILQFLLSGIAGNFRSDSSDSMKLLSMLFAIEDTLIEIGDIQSDFACVAAKPK